RGGMLRHRREHLSGQRFRGVEIPGLETLPGRVQARILLEARPHGDDGLDAAGGAVALLEPLAAAAGARTGTSDRGHWSVGARLREILEARVLPEESELDRSDRPVALLADDDLRHALVRSLLVVYLVAVDEQDHVRVLLDRTRLAQVRHDRALVRPLLQAAVELREREHGYLELLGQRLERARDFGDLG